VMGEAVWCVEMSLLGRKGLIGKTNAALKLHK